MTKRGRLQRMLLPTIVLIALVLCSCLPTDNGSSGTGAAPSLTAMADMTVFVGEPIDVYASAVDPEGDEISYSLANAPTGAAIDAATGLLSWRPAIADTGAVTVALEATDGASASSMSATFTVVAPTLGSEPGLRILRPAPGEAHTYTYGDTLTIAFAMKWCGDQPMLTLVPKEGKSFECIFVQNNTGGNALARDQLTSDSLDDAGRTCKFVRTYENEGYWVGFYRLPLVNYTTLGSDCTLNFGNGTERIDSLRVKVEDVYGFDRCGLNDPGAVVQVTSGAYSGYFSVVPRQ